MSDRPLRHLGKLITLGLALGVALYLAYLAVGAL
jgi:hypothetical protein